MGYNPENSKVKEIESKLPKDSILDGVIINFADGVVKDFVQNTEKWKNENQPAIELTVELKTEKETVTHNQVFTYEAGENGETLYGPKSNIGKFAKKYGLLPKVGMMIKVVTDDSGFGSIKLE